MAEKDDLAKLHLGVLTAEQQERLRQFKVNTRINNEKYLISHPEVEVLIGNFMRDVLFKRPADIREFAADHFTNPNLHEVIGSKMEGNME
ncbi:RIIa domain-containing protein 1 isoform X1 [Sebastes fasciatus]|uniref:RIIa domain-containing protein 1 isoform X1 n=1 Tax=Sebastes fasciatus TaxID=394691 RepID=UPI003D9E5141